MVRLGPVVAEQKGGVNSPDPCMAIDYTELTEGSIRRDGRPTRPNQTRSASVPSLSSGENRSFLGARLARS